MKKTKNSCYTYFAIKGNFDPDEITGILKLTPSNKWKIGDSRKYSKGTYDYSLWEYGRVNKYDVFTSNQMLNTISDLLPKISLLNEIKAKYDVRFVLEVVPQLYVGESTPALAPERKIIEFCYKTETDIDIDLYLYRY